MSAQISVRLSSALLQRLDALAAERGVDRSDVVRAAIRTYLEGPGKEVGHPYALVEDLVGSVAGGPADLGRRHREYLRERLLGG